MSRDPLSRSNFKDSKGQSVITRKRTCVLIQYSSGPFRLGTSKFLDSDLQENTIRHV